MAAAPRPTPPKPKGGKGNDELWVEKHKPKTSGVSRLHVSVW